MKKTTAILSTTNSWALDAQGNSTASRSYNAQSQDTSAGYDNGDMSFTVGNDLVILKGGVGVNAGTGQPSGLVVITITPGGSRP